MLGLSLSKLTLLILVAGVLFVGFRFYTRGRGRTPAEGERPTPEETRPCKACGSFVAASLARPCGRQNCPFGA